MPKLNEFLFGKPDKLKKVPTGTPEQEALHNDVISKAMGLSEGGYQSAQDYLNSFFQPGNQAYENFASPYLTNFNEQILPQIAERFAGGGALSSSGFGQALGGAGASLQSQLAQLFEGLRSQAAGANINQYNQLSQMGLNYSPFAYQNQQGSGGFLGPFGASLGSALGGPLVNGISSLFKGFGGGGGGGGGGGPAMAPGPKTGNYGLPTFLGY
jgi:hypothetical protein